MQETRELNIIDVMFTSNLSLPNLKSTTVPGISDHVIIIVDRGTKPIYNQHKPRKCNKYGQANWGHLNGGCINISDRISVIFEEGKDSLKLLDTFRS